MNQPLKKIQTNNAPRAIGPYSQATLTSSSQNLIFVSGQLPIDPLSGKLVEGDIQTLTTRVIDNIEAILLASGSNLSHVVRSEVFLKDLKKDFAPMNEIYAQRFLGPTTPARQTIQVADLPLGSPIEISCIAVVVV